MSLETLLTLAVAAGILILAALLRLVVFGGIKLIRLIAGRPARQAQRSLPGVVAPRTSLRERSKRVLDGAVALLAFVVASIVRLSRDVWSRASEWWRHAARPSLDEARDASLALMTEQPESSGRLDVLERMTPVLSGNGSAPSDSKETSTPDMQLV